MSSNLTPEGYFRATKKISSGNIVNIPNIASEKIKGNKDTCKVLISTESGKMLKSVLKDKVKGLVKNLFAEVNLNIERQMKTIEEGLEKNGDPIGAALNSISDIQSTLTNQVTKFNENLKTVPLTLEKENIPCKIFIHSSDTHNFIPVADTYLEKINLGTKTIIIGFKGQSAGNSKNPIEIDLADLCIGGLGGPPEESKSVEPAEPAEGEQNGGGHKKKRIIKLKYYSSLLDSDYDHCE